MFQSTKYAAPVQGPSSLRCYRECWIEAVPTLSLDATLTYKLHAVSLHVESVDELFLQSIIESTTY